MGRAQWGNNGMGAASPEERRSIDIESAANADAISEAAPTPKPVLEANSKGDGCSSTTTKNAQEKEIATKNASEQNEKGTPSVEQEILSSIAPLPQARQEDDVVRGRVGAYSVSNPACFRGQREDPACPNSSEENASFRLTRQASGAGTVLTDFEGDFTDLECGSSHKDGTLVEAHLVKDKDLDDVTTEVVHAEKMVPSSTKRTTLLLAVGCLIIVVLVVSLVVALVQAQKEQSGEPTGGNPDLMSDISPNIPEEGEENKPLTNISSSQEDPDALPCFQSHQELYDAMTAYYEDPTPNSSIAQHYGYPIGSWCVKGLRNFAHILTPNRQETSFNVNLAQQATQVALYFHGDIGSWNLSNVRVMDEALWGVQNLSASWGIHHWDVSKVHSFKGLFRDTHWSNDLDLSHWNTSSATDLTQLFRSSSGAVLQSTSIGIDQWDTSRVENMNSLAENSADFNQDITNWQTSRVTSLQSTFKSATAFNQPIGQWNTNSLTKINMAFLNATSFDQALGNWDVSRVTTLRATFQSTPFNQDLGQWNVSQVTTMKGAFRYSSFNQDVGGWNVSSAVDLRWMFNGATNFSQNLCNWGSLLPPSAKVNGMFQNTNCPNQSDPLGPQGPFCFNCN